MHERPPECSQCPNAIQTCLKVFSETAYEEWVCCSACPRLGSLRPGREPSSEPETGCELRSHEQALSHAPEVLRVLAEQGLVHLDPALLGDFEELPPPSPTKMLLALQMELERALAQERYEDAAKLRDLLQRLQESGEI
jgi:hypothetical protein